MTISRTLRTFAALATGAAAITLTTALPSVAGETIRVGKAIPPSFAFALLDVGMDAGIFEKHGLDIEVSGFAGPGAMHQGMSAGAIDIGLGTGGDVALVAKGVEATPIFTISDTPDWVLIAGAKSPYKTIEDLKGEKVAASSKTSTAGWFATHVSQQKGWGAEGIELVPGRIGASLALMRTGQIAAMTADTMFGTSFEQKGIGRIVYRYAEGIPDFPIYVTWTTTNMVENHPDRLKKFNAAWLETVDYALTHRDAAIATIAKTVDVDPAVVSIVYDSTISGFEGDGTMTPKAMETLIQNLKEVGAMPDGFDPAALFTTAFLPDAG